MKPDDPRILEFDDACDLIAKAKDILTAALPGWEIVVVAYHTEAENDVTTTNTTNSRTATILHEAAAVADEVVKDHGED